MEKSTYDFVPVKQKILLEARRLVDTYHIDTGHHCVRDLCELEEYVHRLKTYPGNDHDFITMHLGKYSCQFWYGDTVTSVSTVQRKKWPPG